MLSNLHNFFETISIEIEAIGGNADTSIILCMQIILLEGETTKYLFVKFEFLREINFPLSDAQSKLHMHLLMRPQGG